jgi:hypothetical protein
MCKKIEEIEGIITSPDPIPKYTLNKPGRTSIDEGYLSTNIQKVENEKGISAGRDTTNVGNSCRMRNGYIFNPETKKEGYKVFLYESVDKCKPIFIKELINQKYASLINHKPIPRKKDTPYTELTVPEIIDYGEFQTPVDGVVKNAFYIKMEHFGDTDYKNPAEKDMEADDKTGAIHIAFEHLYSTLGLSHNDKHGRNIFIRISDNPTTTPHSVKIIDFGESVVHPTSPSTNPSSSVFGDWSTLGGKQKKGRKRNTKKRNTTQRKRTKQKRTSRRTSRRRGRKSRQTKPKK